MFEFGLSNNTRKDLLAVDGDASSIFRNTGELKEVSLVRAADFFEEHAIAFVHVMKINIEGGEYDLLEHLIDEKLVTSLDNIQIQFHDFIPDAESRMRGIQEQLARTHYITFRYPFVWENWTLRDRRRT